MLGALLGTNEGITLGDALGASLGTNDGTKLCNTLGASVELGRSLAINDGRSEG